MDDSPRWARFFWPTLMLLGTVALYLPPGIFGGDWTLFTVDFNNLHQYRIRFAQENLRATGTLPAWYPRELGGAPFWSNTQSFPFLPTRLLLLWLPTSKLFAVGVIVAASLAAWFTHLFCRRLGMHPAAAAAAGWTFAAAGYFASRIPPGHLPLLEAYPALPMLLWLIERLAQSSSSVKLRSIDPPPTASLTVPVPRSTDTGRSAFFLGCGAFSVCLAGHPQLSIYSLGAAVLYAIVLLGSKLRWIAVGAIAAGVGCAGFALVPMAMLVTRSTRVLPLDRAGNDLPLPISRLLAAFAPWRDGYPLGNAVNGLKGFRGGDSALFWDTVSYVGVLPWVAFCALLAGVVARRLRIGRRALLLIVVGFGGLVLALPWVQQINLPVQGTLLRSPARLIYLPTFALCVALAAAGQWVIGAKNGVMRRASCALVSVGMALHAWDLSRHTRVFLASDDPAVPVPADVERLIAERSAGGGRIGIDIHLPIGINRDFDDVGFFDSIMLARPYRAVMAMSGASPRLNMQQLPASNLSVRVLKAFGVTALVTDAHRPDLSLAAEFAGMRVYLIDGAAPRARFIASENAMRAGNNQAEQMLRDAAFDPSTKLTVESIHKPELLAGTTKPAGDATVAYQRPEADRIVIQVEAPTLGWLYLLESHDIGWTATIDGEPSEVYPANLAFMAIYVPAGAHRVELTYSTPGKMTGIAISMVSVMALLALSIAAGRSSP